MIYADGSKVKGTWENGKLTTESNQSHPSSSQT